MLITLVAGVRWYYVGRVVETPQVPSQHHLYSFNNFIFGDFLFGPHAKQLSHEMTM